MMIKNVLVASAAVVALSLAGCASSKAPTFADLLGARNADAQQITKDWKKGDALATKGAKATAKGEAKKQKAEELQQKITKLQQKSTKLQEESTKLLQDGQQWSSQGAVIKTDAESRYTQLRANPIPVAPTPVAVPVPTPEAVVE